MKDIRKDYVVFVKILDPRKRFDRESYLPRHPIVNSSIPGKVHLVLKASPNFYGKSSICVLLVFYQHKRDVSADAEDMFCQVGVSPTILIFAPLVVAGICHFGCGKTAVHSQFTRRTGLTYMRQCRLAKNKNDNISTYPESASVVSGNF